jgi:hypothetical protein
MWNIQRSVVGGEFLKVRHRDWFAIFENGEILFCEAVEMITGFVGDDDRDLDKDGLGAEFDFWLLGRSMRFKEVKVNIVAFSQDGGVAGIRCRLNEGAGPAGPTATPTLTDGKGGKKKGDEEEQTRATDYLDSFGKVSFIR